VNVVEGVYLDQAGEDVRGNETAGTGKEDLLLIISHCW
jgi:hypothetical protein